jgi:hypothetical protein
MSITFILVISIDKDVVEKELRATKHALDIHKNGMVRAAKLISTHVSSRSQKIANAGRRHWLCDLACYCRLCNHRYSSVLLYVNHHRETRHQLTTIHCPCCGRHILLPDAEAHLLFIFMMNDVIFPYLVVHKHCTHQQTSGLRITLMICDVSFVVMVVSYGLINHRSIFPNCIFSHVGLFSIFCNY